MTSIIINRLQDNGLQTIGIGCVVEGVKVLMTFKTLELPWLDNRRNVSCIPPGKYIAFKRISPSRNIEVIEIKYVRNRSHIQIHPGNFRTDILGCILPGAAFQDINRDGDLDVIDSTDTFNEIMSLVPDKLVLHIFNATK